MNGVRTRMNLEQAVAAGRRQQQAQQVADIKGAMRIAQDLAVVAHRATDRLGDKLVAGFALAGLLWLVLR